MVFAIVGAVIMTVDFKRLKQTPEDVKQEIDDHKSKGTYKTYKTMQSRWEQSTHYVG